MLRRLLVWIVLFALPLQGIAGAAMIRCGTDAGHHASAEERVAALGNATSPAEHDHAAHHASSGPLVLGEDGEAHRAPDSGAGRATSGHASTGHGSIDHDAAEHIGVGHDAQDRDAPCCAAAIAIAATLSLNVPPAGSWADLVYVPGALPAVYLEGLRRPPRPTDA
jgi:hypothetical protein